MTTLLAIDAATEACSVAVLHAGEISVDFRMLPRAHTRFLLPMVDEMLQQRGLRVADLDGIAFTAGPGSFTGLRVAIATVQGLAFAADIPVVPVSTLASMAMHYTQQHTLAEGSLLLPALDARMDEVYFGRYRVESGQVVPVVEDGLFKPEEVAELPSQGIGLGDGWGYRDRFSDGELLETVVLDQLPHAGAALWLAEQRFKQGAAIDAALAQPVYLRDSVAWQKTENQK